MSSAPDLDDRLDVEQEPGDAPTAAARRPPRKRGRRKPVRRAMVVTHRWLSLVLGAVLVVITTSGALLVYEPELKRVFSPAAYAASGGTDRTSFAGALATVRAAHPAFTPAGVYRVGEVISVTDDETAWNVDPATGRILGEVAADPDWERFLANLHECMLSCADEPGYLPVLAATAIDLGGDSTVSWGGLVLAVFGLLLVVLSLTGLWLWFPKPRRWREGVRLRLRQGRFARDTDLHKVVGMVVLLPLLIWGVSGLEFETRLASDAWYALFPGQHDTEPLKVASAAVEHGTVTTDAAVAAAAAAVPSATVVSVSVPTKDDAAYDLWLSSRADPYGLTDYPGDIEVAVDTKTGKAEIDYGRPDRSVAQVVWDAWVYPVHSGFVVNGWWRIIWLVTGLAPVLLAVTGVSTWLVRIRSKRRRRAARPA